MDRPRHGQSKRIPCAGTHLQCLLELGTIWVPIVGRFCCRCGVLCHWSASPVAYKIDSPTTFSVKHFGHCVLSTVLVTIMLEVLTWPPTAEHYAMLSEVNISFNCIATAGSVRSRVLRTIRCLVGILAWGSYCFLPLLTQASGNITRYAGPFFTLVEPS
jgi:hypothetical protein